MKGTTPTGRLATASNKIKRLTEFVDNKVPGIQKYEGKALSDLTRTEAFKKGVANTFVNGPLRNAATGGAYGRAQRARYLLYTRKELPFWGKAVKTVPAVTAAATLAAGREAIVEDVASVINEGGIQAHDAQMETR